MKFEGYAYVYTIGCQMNRYDSDKLMGVLASRGYRPTQDLDQADIVICNTCAIREKAQEKAFSFLGRLAERKKKNPHLISVMAGCVGQQEKTDVFKRLPHLDIVLGTQAFHRLSHLIDQVKSGDRRVMDVHETHRISEAVTPPLAGPEAGVTRFVTIMEGCDNYCTYCVVPYVRGRERSRQPEHIVAEVRRLADGGVREVTLLGQNVNSYGLKEGICTFPELLDKIDKIEGIRRVRFATSHPKDLSDELIFAIRDLDTVCRQLHLPVQSGANGILKKMNRRYTRERYLERIAALRSHCPGIGISSDMIAGFPHETDSDFEKTLELVREVRFDSLFAFAYSDRPNAPAAQFSGKVDEAVKLERLNTLLSAQETITQEINQQLVGTSQSVLVEGRSRKKRQGQDNQVPGIQMTGRTETGKIVHFDGRGTAPGQIVDITITNAYPHSLWGQVRGENTDETSIA